MHSIATELESIVDRHSGALLSIPGNILEHKPSPTKWSKKEIIGHMVDSALNNARRFVVAQYEANPHIVYNQDKWVELANYQHYNQKDIVELWKLINKHIVSILKTMPRDMADRKCQTESIHTLKWLADDYIKHLRHHLHQVLDLEPVAYP